MCVEEGHELTYTEAIRRLEKLVCRLEDEDNPLEESLACFKEGIRLSRYCREKLAEIEFQVERLFKGEQVETGDCTDPNESAANGLEAGEEST